MIVTRIISKGAMLMASLMLMVIAASCSDDNNKIPQPPTNTIYNIVTLATRNADGVTFTYQKNYDSPAYTYVASGYQIDEKKFPTGCRLLLAYVPQNGDADASGDITVWGVSPIYNGKLTYGDAASFKTWQDTEVTINALWLTDGWINLNGKFPTNGSPKRFALVCDQTTADGPDAELYLVFEPERPDLAPLQTYAAFDVSTLLARQGVKNIRVHVANISVPKEFNFQIQPSIKPW